MEKIAIAIHGGAGTILKKNLTPELQHAYEEKLKESVSRGYQLLKEGHSSLDAVEQAIRILEDSPLFNAGKGSVFNSDGENEMDAAIMEGKTRKAGAVAGVRQIKNPIAAARMVMEKTQHVLLIGEGAERLAKEQGAVLESKEYFWDEKRWEQFQKLKGSQTQQLDHSNDNESGDKKYGTVGAVALDQFGNLAAGSSTGGLTNKMAGRIGDSPIIGAGTYANNATCAVAATGEGEYFIRSVVGHDISAMMEYKELTLQEAAHEAIAVKMTKMGGQGGVIALDKAAHIVFEFNTSGMYRASIDSEGILSVLIFKE